MQVRMHCRRCGREYEPRGDPLRKEWLRCPNRECSKAWAEEREREERLPEGWRDEANHLPASEWKLEWVYADLSESFGNGRAMPRRTRFISWVVVCLLSTVIRYVLGPNGGHIASVAVLAIGGAFIGVARTQAVLSVDLRRSGRIGHWIASGDKYSLSECGVGLPV